MGQPVTSPPEWRRRAGQAGPPAAVAPAADDTELGTLVADGSDEALHRIRALAFEQGHDVAGVRVGPDQYVYAHAGPQRFDTLGWAVYLLATRFEAAGEDDDLAAAVELHDLTVAMGDDVWLWPANAPVGLGAAALYAVTGEEAFLATAERIADLLCETQSPAGEWSDPALTALAARVLAESADLIEPRAAAEAAAAEAAKAKAASEE
jgi:hypothetical protein